MVKKGVLKPSEITIMTFYRAQVQLYSNQFLYNVRNLNESLGLTVAIIKKKVLMSSEITIMIFYKAQIHLYKQALRNLPKEHSALRNINVKTVDSMQDLKNPSSSLMSLLRRQ